MGFSFLTAHNDWLYTPPLELQGGNTYKVEFWYKSLPFPGEPCVEKMEVKWGSLPSAAAMSGQIFYNDNITNDTYIRFEANITPPMDGDYFVGFHAFSDPIQFVLLIDDIKVSQTGTANDDNVTLPEHDKLMTCYPNPFTAGTAVSYQIKESKHVKIEIFNTKGQKVRTLTNSIAMKGKHNLNWDGKDDEGKSIGSGVYYCRMQTDSYKSARKMIKIN